MQCIYLHLFFFMSATEKGEAVFLSVSSSIMAFLSFQCLWIFICFSPWHISSAFSCPDTKTWLLKSSIEMPPLSSHLLASKKNNNKKTNIKCLGKDCRQTLVFIMMLSSEMLLGWKETPGRCWIYWLALTFQLKLSSVYNNLSVSGIYWVLRMGRGGLRVLKSFEKNKKSCASRSILEAVSTAASIITANTVLLEGSMLRG